MVCGSSALAWRLAELGLHSEVQDIDAVSHTDTEFELLLERLHDLARAGRFAFDEPCRSGWVTIPGEDGRFVAGWLTALDVNLGTCRVAFELYDRRSLFLGSSAIGEIAPGAGVERREVLPGLNVPFASLDLLVRINHHVIAYQERRLAVREVSPEATQGLFSAVARHAPFTANGDPTDIARDLEKRRRQALLLQLLSGSADPSAIAALL